jgi:hypothetical protein
MGAQAQPTRAVPGKRDHGQDEHHIAQPGDLNGRQRPCQLLGDDVSTGEEDSGCDNQSDPTQRYLSMTRGLRQRRLVWSPRKNNATRNDILVNLPALVGGLSLCDQSLNEPVFGPDEKREDCT